MYVASTSLEGSLHWREELKGAFYFDFERGPGPGRRSPRTPFTVSSGACPDIVGSAHTWGPYTQLSHIMNCDEIHTSWNSLRLQFFFLIFDVILNLALNWLMILVLVILFSTNYTCISLKILKFYILFFEIRSVPLIWAVYFNGKLLN